LIFIIEFTLLLLSKQKGRPQPPFS